MGGVQRVQRRREAAPRVQRRRAAAPEERLNYHIFRGKMQGVAGLPTPQLIPKHTLVVISTNTESSFSSRLRRKTRPDMAGFSRRPRICRSYIGLRRSYIGLRGPYVGLCTSYTGLCRLQISLRRSYGGGFKGFKGAAKRRRGFKGAAQWRPKKG